MWGSYTDDEKETVKQQLREQIQAMRELTLPYIGRINNEPFQSGYDAWRKQIGPFKDEKAFDQWCLSRVKGWRNRRRWKAWLEERRALSDGKFALTHGNLSQENILVEGTQITGILDWEASAFLPTYAEYIIATELPRKRDEEWLEVMKEVLEPCDEERVEFSNLVKDMSFRKFV